MLWKPLTRRVAELFHLNAPSMEEIAHNHLWRVHKALPSKGEITIFNRSHYEEIIEGAY